jgi:alpha-amylase
MKRITLILGIHNHQPIGNFDWVFDYAVEKSYKPFLELLERHPRVKLAQHYSGVLLDWFVKHRPDLIARLRRLVRRKQVEMMGGAYYEAILSVIPDADKTDQLRKLSKAIKKLFGQSPHGMWLAERVWEQHLTKPIADAGLSYITIDDTHFKYAGFNEEELYGYYRTEEQGRTVSVFPISKTLRYTIPFQQVGRTIDYLRSIATDEGERIVVYADDGEKFGVWPKTYEHVFTGGWLEEFFTALDENSDWITIKHFREVVEQVKPLGRTYLPNSSYAEMMHWALPAHHFVLYEEFEQLLKDQGLSDKYGSFFKGGFWRNFLAKYPESNNMHKKMLRVSRKVREAKARASGGRLPAHLRKARDRVLAAQCNDPYWHGIFGGLYLPNLRYPIYKNLLEAERLLDGKTRSGRLTAEVVDFDGDGVDEVLVESPLINCYITPEGGGSIFEFDFKPRPVNVLDILTRRPEGYHVRLAHTGQGGRSGEGVVSIHDQVLMKEPNLESHLNYDWYRRGSLIDHFFGAETSVEALWGARYRELGDFVDQPYGAKLKRSGRALRVVLSRDGAVSDGDRRHKLTVRKTITFSQGSSAIDVDYRFINREDRPIELWFGCEFNVGLQAGDAPDRYYYSDDGPLEDCILRSKGELENVRVLGLRDEWLGLDVRIDCKGGASFFRFPIETVSLSEAGFERIFQSSVVIPHWRFLLTSEHRIHLVHSIHAV